MSFLRRFRPLLRPLTGWLAGALLAGLSAAPAHAAPLPAPVALGLRPSLASTFMITSPSPNSAVATRTPTISGSGVPLGTTGVTVHISKSGGGSFDGIATYSIANGTFSYTVPSGLALTDGGIYSVSASATTSTSGTINSPSIAFSVDATAPTLTISSTATSPTSARPIPVTLTFSENVFTVDPSKVTVTNGIKGAFSGSFRTYTLDVYATAPGPVTVSAAAGFGQDPAGNPSPAVGPFSITYAQPATAAPVVTAPAANSTSPTSLPTYSGTAPNNSTVTVYVDGSAIGTTSTTSTGAFSRAQSAPLSQGSHTVYATAQSSGSTVSANSAANAFSVDETPTVTITSTAGSPTTTSPIPFGITFSQPVTGFVAGDLGPYATNARSITLTGSGTTYTASVTPAGPGDVTLRVPANVAQSRNGAGNAAATPLPITYQLVTAAPVVSSPANGSYVRTPFPTYSGTAPAGSTVTVYVDGGTGSSTTALSDGSFSIGPSQSSTPLSQSSHTVYATAQSSGEAVSARSATNTFTVDYVHPQVAGFYSPPTGPDPGLANGGSTGAGSVTLQVFFSEPVTGFDISDLQVSNGSVSNFSGSGNGYSFTVSPTLGGPVSVSFPANAVQDAAGQGNDNGASFGFTYTGNYTGPLTWTGASSSAWATASNWSPAQVPTVDNDVTIPAVPTNQPVVSDVQAAKNVTVQAGASLTLAATTAPTTQLTLSNSGNLLLASGSTLTQAAGSELYITGSMTNNGATFALDPTSEVGFGLTALNSHLLNGTAGITFQTLTVGEQGGNDILIMQVPVRVRRKLGVYHNSFTDLSTGGSLTLLSDASGTALIENGDYSYVQGPVTMQRYLDPVTSLGVTYSGPGYRHYSSPMRNSTVADLDTKATGGSFSPEVSKASEYNTSATPGKTTPFPTVFGYDQSRLGSIAGNTYSPFDQGFFVPDGVDDPTNLTAPLVPGQGYAVQISGTEKVDFTGTPYSGDLDVALARQAENADAGWALVGNPYPAPLDGGLIFSLLTQNSNAPGLDQSFYVAESTAPYGGGSMYRSYVAGLEGLQNPYIASGQGFFVRVSEGQTSGTLQFRDAQRLTDPATPVSMHRGSGASTQPTVALTLRGATGPADKLFVYADAQATPAFDSKYDAWKLPNTNGLNLSSRSSQNQGLSIDGRPVFTAATRVALAVGVPAAGTYAISAASLTNLPAGLTAYLNDAATGQTVQLATGTSYRFSVTAAQSQALLLGRFTLSFSTTSALAAASGLSAEQISVYPNPATGRFSVTLPALAGARTVEATLLNSLGQVVRRQSASLTASGAHFDVAAEGLAAGVYSLRLQAGANTLTKRVVLQ